MWECGKRKGVIKIEWKVIKHNNKETPYIISEYGDLYNKETKNNLKGGITNSGYKNYGMSFKNKEQRKEYAHRLVAEYFIPNPENKPQVNHIDGNKENNHYSNLEWVTQEENMKHCMDNGLSALTKPVDQYSIDGEYITSFNSASDAGRNLGDVLMGRGISDAVLKYKKTAYGFQWKFSDDDRIIYPLQENEYFTTKSVVQLTLDGEYIKTFEKANYAYKELGKKDNGMISQVCKGRRGKYAGFKWMYTNDYLHLQK